MQRAPFSQHGLRLALAAVASLVVTPTARADDPLSLPVDPVALTASLVQPATVPVTAVTSDAVAAAVVEIMPATPVEPALPPQVVPAAVAEPNPASEPQPRPLGTPPPPQPAVAPPQPEPAAPDPQPASVTQPVAQPSPQPLALAEPQYQPEPPQYQPLATVDQVACGWILGQNCASAMLIAPNIQSQNEPQYHDDITRYHPLQVFFAIRGGTAPVVTPDTLGVEQVAAALLEPLLEPLGAAPAAPDPGTARAPDPAAPRAGPGARAPTAGARAAPARTATAFSSWTTRHATPARVQPHHQQAHRSRPAHRRPTRHPPSPRRGPEIPVSSSGAAPLGGADGGGLHPTLLLAPFALALVDSARRIARDAVPPVERALDKRRKRPG
ncbi:MAG TPA: hypothetical protein VIA10_05995 [Gaiellaceae bacterium]|jgi:hypothetical protein